MTTSLGKRSSTNGISDIAYSDEKAPVYTSTNQFVQGTKTFNAPQKFLSNVLCSGAYYGDGSHLTNLPVINDPSKLPLAGGTMTGPIVMPTSNDKSSILSGDAISLLDTAVPSEMRLDIYGCQKTGSGNDFIIRNEEPLGVGAQKQFLRLQCGQSYKSDPSLSPETGEPWIEKDEHVKIFDDKSAWNPNHAFRFHNAFDYLNQDAKGGFSVLLSNCSPNPCRVEPPADGTLFYCKDIGGEQPEFWIHEWDTTRVTLVILSDTTFRWAVSMYR
jgi:hypothetical protein